ncbi:MAG: 16S rRNA (guanine(527)-N(7))-methyltransferase RsmG [Coxiellaceae bacterium]|nr:16S rRNA (guanine(527)-N(7))-methyltransferase RsmG [Coxiellaceae bacterium]
MSAQAQEKALAFLRLLEKWNHAYNLTAIHDFDAMITHHLLDSLAVAPFVKGDQIIDIGTGAGFPGVPLALCFPDKQFTLLDSNGKKTRFLIQAKTELSISNIEIVQDRAENYQTAACFDAIIFRAVKSIPEMITKTQHLCCKNGQLLAMKAVYPTEELKDVDHPFTVVPLSVPGLEAERHLIIIERKNNG